MVEAKNYNINARNKFDVDSNRIPPADYAQILHEATVHRVDRVILAVLFGGQNFETFEFTISDSQKEELIKDMAKFWAAVATKTPLEAENTEQTKLIYAQDAGTSIVAIQPIEKAAEALKFIKEEIKRLEEKEEHLLTALQNHMQWSSELVSFDGKVLATWKNSKGSKRFDAKLFQAQHPDIYEKFVAETAGSRRFLLK